MNARFIRQFQNSDINAMILESSTFRNKIITFIKSPSRKGKMKKVIAQTGNNPNASRFTPPPPPPSYLKPNVFASIRPLPEKLKTISDSVLKVWEQTGNNVFRCARQLLVDINQNPEVVKYLTSLGYASKDDKITAQGIKTLILEITGMQKK